MKALIFLLALPVFIAGCTTTPTLFVGGAGVVLETFEPDFSQVQSREPVTFYIKVKNTGSMTSAGGRVRVLGLDDWNPTFTVFEPESCTWNTLLPPSQGTTGQEVTCSIRFDHAPSIPTGTAITYTPIARMEYTYISSLLQSVTIATREELLRLQQSGGALPLETVSTSQSPITLRARIQTPIRVSQNTVTFPLEISAENTGGGTMCMGTHVDCKDKKSWNQIELFIDSGDIHLLDCQQRETISFYQRQSSSLVCKAQVTLDSQTRIIQKTLSLSATYGYFTDTKRSITVVPEVT